MIAKIKELRNQGEEVQLECIDELGFLNSENKRKDKDDVLDGKPLIVGYVNFRDDIVLRNQDAIILKDDLKFFKIKENKPIRNVLLDKALKKLITTLHKN